MERSVSASTPVPAEWTSACLERTDEAFWLIEAATARVVYANGRARAWFGPDAFPVAPGVCATADGSEVEVLIEALEASDWLLGQARSSAAGAVGRDPLTGLPNRALFRERAIGAAASARRNGTCLAVVCLDLDRFGAINETLGHEWGDQLLREAARRLGACVRESDPVGRLGSDEFAVVLTDVAATEDPSALPARLAAALNQPYTLAGRELFVGTTLGVAFYPQDGADFDEVLRGAGAALARAKASLKGGAQFFAASMNSAAAERLALESDLRLALDRGEFVLHYQPKVSCLSGEVAGFEALLRWNHPQRGLVYPADFVGVLEDTGLIVPVGQWVLEEACRQLAAWHRAGLDPVSVAVNLSVRQLRDPKLAETVAAVLAAHGIPHGGLELELTESLLMDNAETVVGLLARLKAMGVRLSVDDFGTGYSSLSYLKRFPLDAVKIDRSFVRDIVSDPDDASITRAIINMAHSLKLEVVAEGVETEPQLAMLVANSCDQIQGFLFSRGVPADEVEARMRSGWTVDKRLLAPSSRERTLLLVDDEANILAALRRLLRRSGYRVLTADSGMAGLEILACEAVDVIISDQRMPNMTGVEFLRKAKELYPDTVRMVLSGYTDLQSVTDAINEGAIYKFLTKPWDDAMLKANIEEAFQRKALSDDNRQLAHQVQVANTELTRVNTRLQEVLETQSRRLALDQALIEVAHEAMRVLPVPVLGVDCDGLVVLANEAAVGELSMLAHVGSALEDSRAAALCVLLSDDGGEGGIGVDGRSWRVSSRPMRTKGGGRAGWLLTFLAEA